MDSAWKTSRSFLLHIAGSRWQSRDYARNPFLCRAIDRTGAPAYIA